MEINNFWMAIRTERDKKMAIPDFVELYGDVSPMPGISQPMVCQRTLEQVDLTKPATDVWNEQFNWFVEEAEKRYGGGS